MGVKISACDCHVSESFTVQTPWQWPPPQNGGPEFRFRWFTDDYVYFDGLTFGIIGVKTNYVKITGFVRRTQD